MKTYPVIILLLLLGTSFSTKAQDSAKVAQTFTELLSICKNVDFGDTNTIKLGTFYKAAPFIAYQGNDKKRKWKDVANYRNPEEKKQVDDICFKINGSVNQATEYRIAQYFTEKESEGTWHILVVTYTRKGREQKAAFGFLKMKGRYALGDID